MANHDLNETLTYLELANRLEPDGDMAYIAQQITIKNTLFQYLVWMEANGLTHHDFAKVLNEPSGTWTMTNMDVPSEAARTAPERESIGTLESYSYVDHRLVRKANSKEAFRRSEDIIFLSGMMKEVADAFVNSDVDINPEKPKGLRWRSEYASVGDNVIDAGGADSDCTSVWVCQMGGDGLYAVFPRNGGEAKMGVRDDDLGKQLITRSTGSQENWVTHFWFEIGIVIRQDTAVQRIASIDATARGTDGDIVWKSLIKAITNLPDPNGAVAFMNKNEYQNILIDAATKTNVNYTPDDPYGRKFLADFMGTPLARLDAIESTETAL